MTPGPQVASVMGVASQVLIVCMPVAYPKASFAYGGAPACSMDPFRGRSFGREAAQGLF
ncbi:hypothetical protein [Sphingosinicella rhizophila]|uniref:Uncharacterized protein n=1 Tax=Sphingosinicella rhizophila TaxID=3050082 RepID=A0ABU3Q7K2_9SPHN|nr:hypothetical protein [Sphingosinicella sp. GR2756]MDT9599385.1 hypothetical protein [Sphingosinicella sp. GR2756]